MLNNPTKYHLQDFKIPAYMMEVTTVVGCKVNCSFCPQKTFLKQYESSKRTLSFVDFKTAVDKMPDTVIIIFAGFAEPFLNENCTEMILYAHEKGHPISIFTTAVGMTLKDVDLIKNIPFSAYPHGGFKLHLPDEKMVANIKITEDYLQVLEALKREQLHEFSAMAMGAVHPDVTHLFPQEIVRNPQMNSRSGNLDREGVTDEYTRSGHEGRVICGRVEYIYNNVMLPNGDVVLCCQDYKMEAVLGNILEQSFEEILPDPLSSYELCKSCIYAIKVPSNFPVLKLVNMHEER